MEPKELPQAALETVSYDRVSHPSAHAEAEPRRPARRPRDGQHHEVRGVALTAALLDIGIVSRRANAEFLPESIPVVRRRTAVRSRHGSVTAKTRSASRRLTGNLDGQSLATLAPAALQDVAPPRSLHPREKSVSSLTPQVARLVGALHPLPILSGNPEPKSSRKKSRRSQIRRRPVDRGSPAAGAEGGIRLRISGSGAPARPLS